jgi:O-antigen ligase
MVASVPNNTTLLKEPTAALTPLLFLNIAVPAMAVLQFRAIALLTSLGFLAVILIFFAQTRRFPLPSGALFWTLAALGLFAAMSALWAPDPIRSFGTGIRFIGFVALASAVAHCLTQQTPAAIRRLENTLVIGLLMGASLALADHLSQNAIRAFVRGLRNWDSTLGFGLKPAISVIVVLLPLVLCLSRFGLMQRILAFLIVISAAALVPAHSAKIACALALIVFLLLLMPAMRPLFHAALPPLGAASVLLPPLLLYFVFLSPPNLEDIARSAAHRVLIWSFVSENIELRPILGWGAEASRLIPGGTDTFSIAVLDRFGLSSETARAWFAMPSAQRLPLHTHNIALQFWLELGAIGAAIGAVLIWLTGRRAASLGGLVATGAIASFVAAIIVGSLSYGLWQEWWIGFLLLVSLNAYGLHLREKKSFDAA